MKKPFGIFSVLVGLLLPLRVRSKPGKWAGEVRRFGSV